MGNDVEALHTAWSKALLLRQSLEKSLKEAKLEEKLVFATLEKAKRSQRVESDITGDELEIQPAFDAAHEEDAAPPALLPEAPLADVVVGQVVCSSTIDGIARRQISTRSAESIVPGASQWVMRRSLHLGGELVARFVLHFNGVLMVSFLASRCIDANV